MGPSAALLFATATAALPFQIAFTDGRCRRCEAQMLGSIQFSDGAVLWAQGFSLPGETGEGDWTLLSSRDGGHSWRELPKSWSHNSETMAFFGSPRDGWIAVPNGMRAEALYASTTDGGRTWRPLQVPSSFVYRIHYRGGGRGEALANNQYAGKSTFFVTQDDGRHWRSSSTGASIWVDQFAYSGTDRPILAGCSGHDTLILSSSDGGRRWLRAKIPQISPAGQMVGCEAGVDGLVFAPKRPGFALLQRHSFPRTMTDGYAAIWRSNDGGEHWSRVFFDRHPVDGPRKTWFVGPYALGHLILVFVSTGITGSVLYSRNDGLSWSRAHLPTPLSGCFTGPRSLTCMAGSKGFRIATLISERAR